MLVVHVSRAGLAIRGEGGEHSFTGSLLTLVPHGGKAKVADVGGTVDEARRKIETLKREGKLPASFRIVEPGEDPWWDAEIAWPPRKSKQHRAPADESEMLLFNPLGEATWSPPAINSLLRYALHAPSPTVVSFSRWRPRPRLTLEPSMDFDAIERAELVDVFEQAWGRSRVTSPVDIARLPASVWPFVRWVALLAAISVNFLAASHRWNLWLRVGAILAAASPAFFAQRKEEQRLRLAPRRSMVS